MNVPVKIIGLMQISRRYFDNISRIKRRFHSSISISPEMMTLKADSIDRLLYDTETGILKKKTEGIYFNEHNSELFYSKPGSFF